MVEAVSILWVDQCVFGSMSEWKQECLAVCIPFGWIELNWRISSKLFVMLTLDHSQNIISVVAFSVIFYSMEPINSRCVYLFKFDLFTIKESFDELHFLRRLNQFSVDLGCNWILVLQWFFRSLNRRIVFLEKPVEWLFLFPFFRNFLLKICKSLNFRHHL